LCVSSRPSRLVSLSLLGNESITSASVHALAASASAATLTDLNVAFCAVDNAALAALVAAVLPPVAAAAAAANSGRGGDSCIEAGRNGGGGGGGSEGRRARHFAKQGPPPRRLCLTLAGKSNNLWATGAYTVAGVEALLGVYSGLRVRYVY